MVMVEQIEENNVNDGYVWSDLTKEELTLEAKEFSLIRVSDRASFHFYIDGRRVNP